MRIKINWGTGIVIFMSLFCGVILLAVYSAFQQPVNMVSDDYYADELRYQEKLDKMNNTAALSEPLTLKYLSNEKMVLLKLPKEAKATSGKIHFFRPSDSRMDFNSTLEENTENAWQFNALRMQPGLWKIKIEWTDENEKVYYSEQSLVVPESKQ